MRILPVLVFVCAAVAASAQTAPPSTVAAPSDVAAPPANATKTPSGLVTKVIAPGKGTDHPTKDDVVTIHYTGWKTDGTMFDSSITKGKPASFPVGRVIAGFSEGLQLMVPGEKRRLWIPEALAYKGAREPKGMLVFDIELIGIPTRAPADVKAPPADAKTTASGLAYKVLQEGVGGRHPRSTGEVTVHRLDDRREDVRQFDRARSAVDVCRRRRDCRLDRGADADVRRREDPLLDSREARLRGQESAVRDARVRRRADQDRPVGFGVASAMRRVARWKRSASARRT
jgi:FKBP-type peptidyl-prolyl cis-trans isomerase